MAEYWAAQRVEQLVALMVDCLVDKMDVVWVADLVAMKDASLVVLMVDLMDAS